MIAWLIGSKGALAKPCNARNNTNFAQAVRRSAKQRRHGEGSDGPQETPGAGRNLTASQPDTVVPSADATIKAVTTHPIWSGVAERLPCIEGRAT